MGNGSRPSIPTASKSRRTRSAQDWPRICRALARVQRYNRGMKSADCFISRRSFLAVKLFGLCFVGDASADSTTNFVICIADDVSWNDLGCRSCGISSTRVPASRTRRAGTDSCPGRCISRAKPQRRALFHPRRSGSTPQPRRGSRACRNGQYPRSSLRYPCKLS